MVKQDTTLSLEEQRPASLVRTLGNALLGSVFVYSGLDILKKPDDSIKFMESMGMPMASEAVKLNATVMTVAGASLAFGVAKKLSALALIGSLISTTLLVHQFWKHEDPEMRKQHLLRFVSNSSVIGGLIHAFTAK
jgi:uncharacterized membrane protein YphA (DoxX/SURF4 family)